MAVPRTECAITTDIGLRLREARLSRNISIRTIASAVGVSASLISQVETGKTQPSVSTLFALSTHLGVSMDELLGVANSAPHANVRPLAEPMFGHHGSASPPVQRAGDNPVLEMENGVRWERLAVGGGGPADGMLVTYGPGASSSIEGTMMQHNGFEYGFVLEGQITMQLDFETYDLGPGDSLQLDSLRPHAYSNRGVVPARALFFVIGTGPGNAETTVPPGTHLNSAVDVLRAIGNITA
jgi:transcriptional regulator with XRE-family HTH domain/mannose-6-phosphate isomerase-like protein (cupin superfamily)